MHEQTDHLLTKKVGTGSTVRLLLEIGLIAGAWVSQRSNLWRGTGNCISAQKLRMLTTVETEHFKGDHMVWNKSLQIKFRQWVGSSLSEGKFPRKFTENWETNTESRGQHQNAWCSSNSTQRITQHWRSPRAQRQKVAEEVTGDV